jgi:organic hydroperoxide reductase OsmC/OhrA
MRPPGGQQFEAAVQDAQDNCPVSKALTDTTITVEGTLASQSAARD